MGWNHSCISITSGQGGGVLPPKTVCYLTLQSTNLHLKIETNVTFAFLLCIMVLELYLFMQKYLGNGSTKGYLYEPFSNRNVMPLSQILHHGWLTVVRAGNCDRTDPLWHKNCYQPTTMIWWAPLQIIHVLMFICSQYKLTAAINPLGSNKLIESLLAFNRGHPCLGLAAIFAGMLYNVQIIQKSSTRNIMHVSIIVLELPAKLQCTVGHWLNGLNGEYYGNDLFCLRSRISEVDTLYKLIQWANC